MICRIFCITPRSVLFQEVTKNAVYFGGVSVWEHFVNSICSCKWKKETRNEVQLRNYALIFSLVSSFCCIHFSKPLG